MSQPPAEEQACLAAFRSAEMQVQAGELRAAKKQLLSCAQPMCGKFLRRQCAARFGDLEPEVPSVIPLVKDGAEIIVRDVRVAVDSETSTPADGRAIFVDPGAHEFTFSVAGEVIARETATILPGQRNRRVWAALRHDDEPTAAPAPRAQPKTVKLAAAAIDEPASDAQTQEAPVVLKPVDRVPAEKVAGRRTVLAFVLGAGGVAALGAGALLTYWGRGDNDRLGACSPACPSGAVEHVHRLYIGADVAFGVGAAALAGASWAYLSHRTRRAENTDEASLRVDVRPTTSGAIAGVRGTF
ncbi:MAG: hypothetical protein ACJ8F1_11570 [Polyangia bacterium]